MAARDVFVLDAVRTPIGKLGGALSHLRPDDLARLAGAVAHQLKRAGSGVGVASLCVGVGQGTAVVLER